MQNNQVFCQNCGTQNDTAANFCLSCGAPLSASGPVRPQPATQSGARPHVPNHLVWAILATIFCCLPVGIVSIVYAAQVNGKLAAGDVQGAVQASNRAKTWAWVSFGLVLIPIGLWILLVILLGLGAAIGA